MSLRTVADALSQILAEISPFSPMNVPLSAALGLTLAEPVVSDIDSPPFDKSLMDGYAVQAADLANGSAGFSVIEEVTAGKVPRNAVQSGTAIRIMTGAPIPVGADTVVRVEEATLNVAENRVQLRANVRPGANILKRGTSVRAGCEVLPAGRSLRAQELGALAELGRTPVRVRPRPTVAILATGDELVPVDAVPAAGQIRNSNETMLAAQVQAAGATPVPLGIARDCRDELRAKILRGLQHDLLLLSGGVSAGVLDLVPSELANAGVREVFHQVSLKPGKPVWFGVYGRSGEVPAGAHLDRAFVFGLPGNPVSSLVCFELFVRTAIRRLMGVEPAQSPPVRARLAQAHVARGDRPTYHPAQLRWTENGPIVRTVRWHGSSDLCGTLDADSMALFPAGDAEYPAGAVVDVFPWSRHAAD